MKAVMKAISPKRCKLIANVKATVELSKVKPNIEVPFRCYIYCTMRRAKRPGEILLIHTPDAKIHRGNGWVIGEFLCDDVAVIFDTNGNAENYMTDILPSILQKTELSYDEFGAYVGSRADKNSIYGWNITDLKIYEEPKSLFEFHKYGAPDMESIAEELCEYCKATDDGRHSSYVCPQGYVSCEGRFCCEAYEQYLDENFSIVSPPKSWIYVEGLL